MSQDFCNFLEQDWFEGFKEFYFDGEGMEDKRAHLFRRAFPSMSEIGIYSAENITNGFIKELIAPVCPLKTLKLANCPQIFAELLGLAAECQVQVELNCFGKEFVDEEPAEDNGAGIEAWEFDSDDEY
jgi:hypothetical protein